MSDTNLNLHFLPAAQVSTVQYGSEHVTTYLVHLSVDVEIVRTWSVSKGHGLAWRVVTPEHATGFLPYTDVSGLSGDDVDIEANELLRDLVRTGWDVLAPAMVLVKLAA